MSINKPPPQRGQPPRKDPWENLRATGLEADIAYCEARLELLGKPKSLNQQAQCRAFRLLIHNLTQMLDCLLGKGRTPG